MLVEKPADGMPDDSEAVIGLSTELLGDASEDGTPVLRDGV